MIVPDSPTAQPVEALTKAVSSKRLPWGRGFCHTQVPSPVETQAVAAPGRSRTAEVASTSPTRQARSSLT